MEKNLKTILTSELHCAHAYLDRLFHAMLEIQNLGHTASMKTIGQSAILELASHLKQALNPSLIEQKEGTPQAFQFSELKTQVNGQVQWVESLLCLNLGNDELIPFCVDYINKLYSFAQKLHKLSLSKGDIEIQYPRLNLIEMFSEEDELKPEQENVPLFYLSMENVLKLKQDNILSVDSLDWQRNKKYEKFIQDGHQDIFNKEHDKALEKFQKALNYKETSEALTLVGWAYSLLGDYEKAKSHCLKAIQKDPDYGPPYNDLGSYLLHEGQIEESLKWFELAKKAVRYQNREYPYINAGRAYMMCKNYQKALKEFSMALTLAPYHEELHDTVGRLKKTLGKVKGLNIEGKNSNDLPPSVF